MAEGDKGTKRVLILPLPDGCNHSKGLHRKEGGSTRPNVCRPFRGCWCFLVQNSNQHALETDGTYQYDQSRGSTTIGLTHDEVPTTSNFCENILMERSVVVGAVAKRMYSSFRLNSRLRRLASLQLIRNLHTIPNWIPKALNPIDKPSRRARSHVC